jgi:DNA-binding transcriptional regulator LsrR (DeoR family)
MISRAVDRSGLLWPHGNQTQADIARRLGISRSMVSRELTLAREMGIIDIRIKYPRDTHTAHGQRLMRLFPHLLDAVIAPTFSEEPDAVRAMIGRAAANYLIGHLKPGQRLALGCGRTLRAVVDALPRQPIAGIEIVQAMGNIGHEAHGIDYNEIARQAADALSGRVYYVSAPAILGKRAGQASDFIEANPVLSHALSLAQQADVVAVGLGSLESDQLYAQAGLIDSDELDTLRGRAVGDICGRFFDLNGGEVIAPFAGRTIGITLQDLRSAPISIGIAGGADKVEPLLGALRGERINVLITDELTVRRMIARGGYDSEEDAQ